MKTYSLCISVQKLENLKAGISFIVSHPATERWKGFIRKPRKQVRFFTQSPHLFHTFVVERIVERTLLGEKIVEITIKHQ